ncbi:hypothetical protein [Bdellovibrio bacteriovorus]|uniref:hypothetical protein n=1 Tax=Bdellovibrio bacteriovorus TaxID=959 RepID=UPI003AA9CC37
MNNEFVFHAVGHGVEVIPLSEFLKDRDILVQFDFETTRDQDLKLDGFIHGSKGDEYSQSQLLGIVLAKWFKAEGAFFSNGTDKYICSELVAVTFAYIFGKFKDLNKDLVTPRELHDLFVSEALGL